MTRAEHARNALPLPAQATPPGVQMFFDGPLVVALRRLEEVVEHLRRLNDEAASNTRATDHQAESGKRFERKLDHIIELLEDLTRTKSRTRRS